MRCFWRLRRPVKLWHKTGKEGKVPRVGEKTQSRAVVGKNMQAGAVSYSMGSLCASKLNGCPHPGAEIMHAKFTKGGRG